MSDEGAGGPDLCRVRDGVYADDLVLAAVGWLDVFTWLVEHPVGFDGLCQGLGISPRPADVLCTLLRAMGLLEVGDDPLRPTAIARAHLVAGAALDLRPYYASLRDRPTYRELAGVSCAQ